MKVTEVVYTAQDQASQTADWIRLKMTLERQGVDVSPTETFEGESKFMNGRAWLMQAEYEQVDADALRVEAFDLEVPSHVLSVNGHPFNIPLTGSNQTRTYRFQL
jgi:hypothetical protein